MVDSAFFFILRRRSNELQELESFWWPGIFYIKMSIFLKFQISMLTELILVLVAIITLRHRVYFPFFALVLFYGVKQKVYLALFRFQSCCFYNAGLQPFPCFTVINTNYLHQLTWFVLLVFFQCNFYIRKFGIYSIDSPLRCFWKRHNDTTFQGNYNHKVTPNIAQVWLGHYSVTAWYIDLLLQFFLFLYILKLAFRILPQKHIFCKIK